MYNYPNNFYKRRPIQNNNRFIGGGFLAPFLLGGITGGLVAPAFYNPRPAYYPYPVPYPTYYQNYYY